MLVSSHRGRKEGIKTGHRMGCLHDEHLGGRQFSGVENEAGLVNAQHDGYKVKRRENWWGGAMAGGGRLMLGRMMSLRELRSESTIRRVLGVDIEWFMRLVGVKETSQF